jgi:GntR family transcriptional regulator, transcriptional repressor for pyruvate dehydrogenase complex
MILGLTPGSSIPSEAELATHHGVSRVTIREAVKMVAGRGLLDLARGRHAVVREPDAEALGHFMASIVQNDAAGVLLLTEARMSVEVQCAGLAAQRASHTDIAAIADSLINMRRILTGPDAETANLEFHDADIAFHAAVAEASKNRILSGILKAMVPALQKSFGLLRDHRTEMGLSSEQVVIAHQRILDCIRASDHAGAEAAMRVHLTDVRRDLLAL